MELSPVISFEDLGIELCNAKTKRREKRPIFGKLTYESIPFYYEKWGQIFRKKYVLNAPHNNKDKKYYSMEEVQQLYINYLKQNNIKPTGIVKEVMEHDNRTTKRND